MALTPIANGANQVTSDQEMMAAHAQLNTLVTKEVEKTGEAFQAMNTQIQKNLSALAEENVQLKKRVTFLESELRQEKTLREEERRNTLEVIQELKGEVQTVKTEQAKTNTKLNKLEGLVGEIQKILQAVRGRLNCFWDNYIHKHRAWMEGYDRAHPLK